MHFIEKFDGENIDGQHLRPPVLTILLDIIERENFDILLESVNISKIALHVYRVPVYVYIAIQCLWSCLNYSDCSIREFCIGILLYTFVLFQSSLVHMLSFTMHCYLLQALHLRSLNYSSCRCLVMSTTYGHWLP